MIPMQLSHLPIWKKEILDTSIHLLTRFLTFCANLSKGHVLMVTSFRNGPYLRTRDLHYIQDAGSPVPLELVMSCLCLMYK